MKSRIFAVSLFGRVLLGGNLIKPAPVPTQCRGLGTPIPSLPARRPHHAAASVQSRTPLFSPDARRRVEESCVLSLFVPYPVGCSRAFTGRNGRSCRWAFVR